jgi:hypothetical protein
VGSGGYLRDHQGENAIGFTPTPSGYQPLPSPISAMSYELLATLNPEPIFEFSLPFAFPNLAFVLVLFWAIIGGKKRIK